MAHGVILAAASPTLQTLLKKHQSSGSSVSFAFRLETIPSRVIKIMLEFVYSGKLIVSQDDVELLYKGADVLQMTTLTDVCIKVGQAFGLTLDDKHVNDAADEEANQQTEDAAMYDITSGELTQAESASNSKAALADNTGDQEGRANLETDNQSEGVFLADEMLQDTSANGNNLGVVCREMAGMQQFTFITICDESVLCN